MPPSKLDRRLVIEQLCEQRDTLARLVGAPKMDPLIRAAIHLSRQKVEQIMSRDLDSIEWETLERSELVEGLKDARTPYLEQVRQRIKRWTGNILKQPEYVGACEAYQMQESKGGPLFRRELNQFLQNYSYSQLDISPNQPLYHGVEASPTVDFEPHAPVKGKTNGTNGQCRPKLMSPSVYADTLQSIVQNGLRANPTMENLPGLDTVFAVRQPISSYGLAGVRFTLEDDKAWGRTHNPIEGIQIAKPVLKRPFLVYLKSPDFLDLPEDQECMGSQKLFQSLKLDQYLDYQMRLEQELAQRGVEYVIIDPDGVEV